MTEKEREFKVKMIEKYDGRIEQLNNERVNILMRGCLGISFGIWGLFSMMAGSDNLENYFDIFQVFAGAAGIIASLGISVNSTFKTISNIAKKANLQTEVEKLKNELEVDKIMNSENYVNEEERGHSR